MLNIRLFLNLFFREAHGRRCDAHRIGALLGLKYIQQFVLVAALQRNARSARRTVPARLAMVIKHAEIVAVVIGTVFPFPVKVLETTVLVCNIPKLERIAIVV